MLEKEPGSRYDGYLDLIEACDDPYTLWKIQKVALSHIIVAGAKTARAQRVIAALALTDIVPMPLDLTAG